MLKVLLIIEEQLESRNLMAALRKTGMDVETHTSEAGLSEKLLGFKSDVIFVSVLGKKLNGLTVCKKIESAGRKNSKIVYILRPNSGISQADIAQIKVDSFLAESADLETIISTIAKLVGQDGKPWLEKLHRDGVELKSSPSSAAAQPKDSASDLIRVGSQASPPSVEENKKRTQRYESLVKDIKVSSKSTVTKADAKRIQKDLQKDWKKEDLESQDALKRDFVKAMFKKND